MKSTIALIALCMAAATRLCAAEQLEQVMVKSIIVSVPPGTDVSLNDIESKKYIGMNNVKVLSEPQILMVAGQEASVDVSTKVKVKDAKTGIAKDTQLGIMLTLNVDVNATGIMKYAAKYLSRSTKGNAKLTDLRDDQLVETTADVETACKTGESMLMQTKGRDGQGQVQYVYLKFVRIPKEKKAEL